MGTDAAGNWDGVNMAVNESTYLILFGHKFTGWRATVLFIIIAHLTGAVIAGILAACLMALA